MEYGTYHNIITLLFKMNVTTSCTHVFFESVIGMQNVNHTHFYVPTS